MGALLDKCRSCSSYWTASQRLNRATHVDEACGPPVCIAPGRTMVNHFEPEPREVLSRVEVPTVEASDDRVDALLLFAAVASRFYQQPLRGGAAIPPITETDPPDRNVQAMQ